MALIPHTLPFTAMPTDIDELGHIKNAVRVRPEIAMPFFDQASGLST